MINGSHPENDSIYRLTYCGYARRWDQTCSSAKYVCTSPGPIFETESFQDITVFWINRIEDIDVARFQEDLDQKSSRKCYNDQERENCDVQAKLLNDCDEFTFFDPTEPQREDKIRMLTIDPRHSTTSIHVHGMEIRPTFDGNPLSWFSNKGDKGVGYLSYDMNYYDKPASEKQIIDDVIKFFLEKVDGTPLNYKINVYPNVQQPGTLWYHDHTMANTRFNVGAGLFGFYLIRDPSAEAPLPPREN